MSKSAIRHIVLVAGTTTQVNLDNTLHIQVDDDPLRQVTFLSDTGAEVTVIGPTHLKLLDIDIDNLDNVRDEVRVTSADGASTQCLGTIHTILHKCDESTSETMYVWNGVQMACLAYQHRQDLHGPSIHPLGPYSVQSVGATEAVSWAIIGHILDGSSGPCPFQRNEKAINFPLFPLPIVVGLK